MYVRAGLGIVQKESKLLYPTSRKWFHLNPARFTFFNSLDSHFLLVKMKPNRAETKIGERVVGKEGECY